MQHLLKPRLSFQAIHQNSVSKEVETQLDSSEDYNPEPYLVTTTSTNRITNSNYFEIF